MSKDRKVIFYHHHLLRMMMMLFICHFFSCVSFLWFRGLVKQQINVKTIVFFYHLSIIIFIFILFHLHHHLFLASFCLMNRWTPSLFHTKIISDSQQLQPYSDLLFISWYWFSISHKLHPDYCGASKNNQ